MWRCKRKPLDLDIILTFYSMLLNRYGWFFACLKKKNWLARHLWKLNIWNFFIDMKLSQHVSITSQHSECQLATSMHKVFSSSGVGWTELLSGSFLLAGVAVLHILLNWSRVDWTNEADEPTFSGFNGWPDSIGVALPENWFIVGPSVTADSAGVAVFCGSYDQSVV